MLIYSRTIREARCLAPSVASHLIRAKSKDTLDSRCWKILTLLLPDLLKHEDC